ncbi:WG repeat-containing protein [Novosphingobium sp. KACC 22771]|uniref:WG repeat-containing protein n=1 Tax=Novosphingobium sp. KACC 22771 TaxID=3025670 RepID=UPI0023659B82|nr:WG repeat-containing protein [Novosphingobium sp. KACC 22771]WDF75221.1 WG repeat-containing protein [Novosphingobium sp. KACC 22771]
MKRLAFAVALLISTGVEAQTLRRVPLIGYVDRSGQIIEPAQWEAGSPHFLGDWVAVRRDGKAGFLNLRTRATTGLIFDEVNEDLLFRHKLFAHGPEPVRVGDKWGYADQTGRIVIEPRFAGARSFDEAGLAIIQIPAKDGYGLSAGMIDRSGRVVVEPRYGIIRPFGGHTLTGVSKDGLFGAIDRTGREVISMRFAAIGGFAANGLAPATLTGGYGMGSSRWGFVDATGNFVIPERFNSADDFERPPSDGELYAPAGLARVTLLSGENAYIDAKGEVVTRFPAGIGVWGISPNGLARFQDSSNGRYGFADAKTGLIVIPARFSGASAFDDHGLAAAKENERAGYIHADGQWAFPPRFTATSRFDSIGLARVTEEGRTELIDRNGKVVTTLAHGDQFFIQDNDFSAFNVFPGQEEAPTQHFGTWALDATLYAVPRMPSLMPTTTGKIRLSFASDDTLVRWRIETEGWVVTLVNEEGPSGAPYVTRITRLADFPADAESLLTLLARQFDGHSTPSAAAIPAANAAQAAQAKQASLILANRARYLSQLRGSTSDLTPALAAMRKRVSEQFGKLSGMPCMPPQCVY